MYTSRVSLTPRETGKMVRPLSRKDIFYSGSVTNLREYQSQKSLTNYRNSVISLTKYEKDARDARDGISEIEKGERKYMTHIEHIFPCQYLFQNDLFFSFVANMCRIWSLSMLSVTWIV